MIWKGYKNPLKTEEMWELIPENQTKNITEEFNKIWVPTVHRKREKALRKASKGENIITDINVGIILVKTFWPQMLFVGFIKFVASFLTFVNPLVLDLLIAYMSPNNTEPVWKGFFYAALMLIAPLFESLLNGQFEYKNNLLVMKIRSCLISVIYKKVKTIKH